MAKRICLPCIAVVVGIMVVGGIVCLMGSPVSGDTWGHKFPHSYLYLSSHQEPASFRARHSKTATGIEFGRCAYIWDSN